MGNLRRKLEGYVEPVGQGFKTFQNAEQNIPVDGNWHFERAIDNTVECQPHPGVMFVHSVPTQNNPMLGKTPFVRSV